VCGRGSVENHGHFVFWAPDVELVVFLFDESLDALVAEGVAAHGEKAGRIDLRVLLVADGATERVHLLLK